MKDYKNRCSAKSADEESLTGDEQQVVKGRGTSF